MLSSNRQTEQHCRPWRRHDDEYRNGRIPPVSQDHGWAPKSDLIKPTGVMDGIKPGSDYRFTLAASFKWMTFSGGTVWSPKALLQQSYASLAMKPRGLFSIPTLVLIFATPLAA